MGLDTVELVIDIEETFGITISDHEAADIVTVGQLCDFITARVPLVGGTQSARACLTSRAFYRLRQAFVHTVGVARENVQPAGDLALLLPWRHRRGLWHNLQQSLELNLPRLKRPPIVTGILMLAVFLGALCSAIGSVGAGLVTSYIAFGMVFLLGGMAAYELSRPVAKVLPCRTVGELTTMIVVGNRAALVEKGIGWTAEDVFTTVRALIVDHFDVPQERVVREARIVADLGLD